VLSIAQRGAAIGEKARADAVARLAARIAEQAPDVRVSIDGDGITITGRRILSDPRFLWVGSLIR